MFNCPSQVLLSKFQIEADAPPPPPSIGYNTDHIPLNMEARVALQAKVNHN